MCGTQDEYRKGTKWGYEEVQDTDNWSRTWTVCSWSEQLLTGSCSERVGIEMVEW